MYIYLACLTYITVYRKFIYKIMDNGCGFFFIGCGGYVNSLNGDSVISSPSNWYNELEAHESGSLSEYPDQCFWFIEARHAAETVLLKSNVQSKLGIPNPLPLIVS